MEEFLGKEVKAVISTELGGGNTASAFYVGAMTDRLIMDGDPAGRSVPCLQHSTYFLNNVPIYPISVMNKFGEGAVFTKVYDDFRAEDLVRALAVVSQNTIAVVDHVNTAKVLKDAVIKGAISHAWKLGEAFRLAKEAGKDYAQEVAQAGGGVKIFQGVVDSNDWGTKDGYTLGTMVVKGEGDYAGKEYKIWYQNENIITWMDGEYYATVPDLVCVFNEFFFRIQHTLILEKFLFDICLLLLCLLQHLIKNRFCNLVDVYKRQVGAFNIVNFLLQLIFHCSIALFRCHKVAVLGRVGSP